jgi:uncharacterized protein (DUF697 family)
LAQLGINLSDLVVGGIIVGTLDAIWTIGIGKTAKKIFIEDDLAHVEDD